MELATKVDKEVGRMILSLEKMDMAEKIEAINQIKIRLHKLSPFINEPVDCVLWVKGDIVGANDYNPNAVAPPEMELLETSIGEDGFTQPIVTWLNEGEYEVVDGFHRNRVGKESEKIKERLHSYLPVTMINIDREDRGDRIAATIRHNRARGKHRIDSMSEIVVELKRRNWSPKKIAYKLGMDQDEILRLTQISGLAEMFSDSEFTEAWEAEIMDDSEIVEDYDALD